MSNAQSIERFADVYLASRVQTGSLISTRDAIQSIRTIYPNCKLSDRELADKVAEKALAQGCSVSFDSQDS